MLTDTEYQFLDHFLKKLIKNPLSVAFRYPVDPEADHVPDYLQIISNPMDLSTVAEKLSSKSYTQSSQFIDDIQLIWKNAMTYNSKGMLLHSIADFLRKICEEKLAVIPKTPAEVAALKMKKLNKRLQDALSIPMPELSLTKQLPISSFPLHI